MAIGGSGDARIDGLLSGCVWTNATVTWSDPDSHGDFGAYRVDMDGDGRSAQAEGFGRLTSTQRAAATKILEASGPGADFSVEGFTGLGVRYAGASGAGDIRIARTSDAATAYAFSPGSGYGGDVWLGKSCVKPVAGNYAHATLLHELGHALGLKHSHEAGTLGAVPSSWDSLEFTVMSYRAHLGAAPKGYTFEAWGAPQTYMMLDIAALQKLYGADFSANAGDTTYEWSPGSGRTLVDGKAAIAAGGNRIFATIWDGGGRDCYDLSAYKTNLSVDLRPGKHSVFSQAQLADLGGGPNDGHARGNIFNALQYKGSERSLIEDVRAGSGNDWIVGNAAQNRLKGWNGNDHLEGGGGVDRLGGGRGADVFIFRSGDSVPSSYDRIAPSGGAPAFERPGRSGGDVIDLRPIDADTTRSGDQAFHFGAKGKGGLWLTDSGGATYVHGNTDRDSAAEFRVKIIDHSIHADDYSAGDFLL